MSEEHPIRMKVTWEFSLTLIGLALGTPFLLGLMTASDPQRPEKSSVLIGLASTTTILYALALLGIAVRIVKAGRNLPKPERRQARIQTFNQIGLGLAITTLGTIGAIWSHNLAKPGYIFVIPTGIILFGLTLLGSAMGCGGD